DHLRKQNSPDVTGLASRMVDMLREAEAHAGRLREDAEGDAQRIAARAEEEAELTLRTAREQADRLRSETEQEAERVRTEVQSSAGQAAADARRRLSEAMSLRDSVQLELDRFSYRLAGFATHAMGEPEAVPQDGSADIWLAPSAPGNGAGQPGPPTPTPALEP